MLTNWFGNMATTPIRDEQLLKQFEEIDKMGEEEKAHKEQVQAVRANCVKTSC